MKILSGDEQIAGTEATVQQFWQWSASRLLDNTLRGIFAERKRAWKELASSE